MEAAPSQSTVEVAGTALVKGVVSAVPGVGAPIAEIIGLVTAVGFQRRMDDWYQSVVEAIEDVQDRVEDLEGLQSDPEFLDMLVATTRAAQATSREEKLVLFRNAVVNSVLPGAPDEDLKQRFVRIVDEMIPFHMRLLVFLDDPRGWYAAHPEIPVQSLLMGSRMAILEPVFSELGQGQLERLLADLSRWGLVSGGYQAMMTESGVWASSTTQLGKHFLAFVASPATAGEC